MGEIENKKFIRLREKEGMWRELPHEEVGVNLDPERHVVYERVPENPWPENLEQGSILTLSFGDLYILICEVAHDSENVGQLAVMSFDSYGKVKREFIYKENVTYIDDIFGKRIWTSIKAYRV